MKKELGIIMMTLLLVGCSSNGPKETTNETTNGTWDYREGNVLAKQSTKLLVVDSTDVTEIELKPELETVEQILKVVQPEAVWVTPINESELEAVEVGDEVSLEITGDISDSYPAEASAKRITVIDKTQ
ncbi:DUF3221 domain-containing protein [Paenibacillus sp. GSMTC-2017]|uniref:DUF3221 domain-containing protein n=1 Tax=Paenibacillus sp. GSMTC-2017 TaxID=2794350 RepID=UPI0018D6E631|nr:DUF3221 domain-containing protein [Paenibacillus sp. GSMTC-2017]MBH5318879.1 DUF3221 domain-containing protein [Paenibacillus sp. GSMTC-2017]